MKTMTMTLLTLAATLAISTNKASAQESIVTLKATIPFSFRVGSSQAMLAGDYRLTRTGVTWRLTNIDTGSGVTRISQKAPGTMETHPKLVFECVANRCSLSRIHARSAEGDAYWPAPKPNKSDAAESARVVFIPAAATAM